MAALIAMGLMLAALSGAASIVFGWHDHGPARTVAAALLERHQAAVSAALTAPTLVGAVNAPAAWWMAVGPWSSCVDLSGVVATWGHDGLPAPPDAVAAELGRLTLDAPGYGVAGGGVVRQRTGAAVALPCAVPDGAVVAVTRSR